MFPRLVPWLGVLVLLILKPNRTGRAWWVWLPLLCVAGIKGIAGTVMGIVPSEVLDYFGLAFSSLAFGLATVWLLAGYLGHRLRFLVFLKTLAVAVGISAAAYLVRSEWSEAAQTLGVLVFVGVSVLVAMAALNLAGWLCRRQYRPVGLTLWLVACIGTLWLLIAAPFFVFASMASGGLQNAAEFVAATLTFAGLTFAVMLPFLILAFANGLFRERLKELLHLRVAAPPPVIAPPLPGLSPAN